MPSILDKVLRMGEGRVLRKLSNLADQVDRLEPQFQAMTDAELREETPRFRARLAAGETLDSLLPEAFAAVREASVRTLGQRHFHVQLMGGAALHLGNIAEMKTGEGKTLVATTAAYLNALEGKGVHVVTTNDYLAKYQGELMGRVYRFLGMTTGIILTGQEPAERREQYNADITYGTNNEFGFDYLRDNMAWGPEELVQRGHHFAIVDEVDSILIDEARTPLIISGPSSGDANRWYTEFAKLVLRLTNGVDYEVDEKKKTVGVLEPGIARVEDYLGIDNLYESLNTPLIGFLNNAIKAKELFKRDKDYVVLNGEVMIVDEHTGRMLPGRRYNEGMHQAIEAKEGVEIKAENQTLATITLQNYFRLYDKLSGMTGTAATEAAEFQSTYKIGVVPIPTNKPMIRIDQPDLVYKNEKGKWDSVVEDIAQRYATGQPVLVGTTSVEKSEYLSGLLRRRGIPHSVLNAKEHEREAAVVALAGRKGAVTVATNMAGRGTDIMLGGNAEFLAVQRMEEDGYDATEQPEEYEAAWPAYLAEAKAAVAAEHDEVTALGGLYVLGTERHESRRIDNQLRGRSGRQGDPGESRFYLSMQDDLMRLFNSQLAEGMMNRAGFPDDMPLESKMVTRGIQSAQTQVEARNAEIRKNVLKYDDVMSRQRDVIYNERRQVLEGADLENQVDQFRDDVIKAYVDGATAEGTADTWDLDSLWTAIKTVYPVSITPDDVIVAAGGAAKLTPELLTRALQEDADEAYARREELIGEEAMRQLERRVVLSVLDRKWREHLYEMDYLKEGIGLRAMAQRDPLVEYQREGYQLFSAMTDAIKEESVGFLYNLEVQPVEPELELDVETAATFGSESPFGTGDETEEAEAAEGELSDAGADEVIVVDEPADSAEDVEAESVAVITETPLKGAAFGAAAARPMTMAEQIMAQMAQKARKSQSVAGGAQAGTVAIGPDEDGNPALEVPEPDLNARPAEAFAAAAGAAEVVPEVDSAPQSAGADTVVVSEPVVVTEPEAVAITEPTVVAEPVVERVTEAVVVAEPTIVSEPEPQAAAAEPVAEDTVVVPPQVVSEPKKQKDGQKKDQGKKHQQKSGNKQAARKLHGEASAPEKDGQTFPGAARNAPCPCGSGKKYKVCHGKNE